jgi:hypothetical protein
MVIIIRYSVVIFWVCFSSLVNAQGLTVPSGEWGLSFGNSTRFTGLRFNFIDRNIDDIRGINFTIWYDKKFEDYTGSFKGLGVGVPMAVGTRYRYGLSVGIFGVGAGYDLTGFNVAGLAVGAGSNVSGINLGGLAVGAGNRVTGLNIGGLAVGSGDRITGLNVGGLAVGTGYNIEGFSLGGLAVGAGENIRGISLSVLVVGSGETIRGISLAGLVTGAGESISGIQVGGLAVASGETIKGINLAGLAVGSPEITGFSAALAVGGVHITGLTIAPAYFRIQGENGSMKGMSISAFNHILGSQHGLAIGIFNSAWEINGIQIGLLNYVRENRKGLRLLPLFNTRFN